jgi:hypothetical protein
VATKEMKIRSNKFIISTIYIHGLAKPQTKNSISAAVRSSEAAGGTRLFPAVTRTPLAKFRSQVFAYFFRQKSMKRKIQTLFHFILPSYLKTAKHIIKSSSTA